MAEEKDTSIIGAIQGQAVEPQDLLRCLAECVSLGRDREEAAFSKIMDIFGHDSLKSLAVYLRLQALAGAMNRSWESLWEKAEGPEGGVSLASEAVCRAAAVHPLIEKNNELVFEAKSFVKRVRSIIDARAAEKGGEQDKKK